MIFKKVVDYDEIILGLIVDEDALAQEADESMQYVVAIDWI